MRTQNLFHISERSLLSDYASKMSEAMIRNRATLEVRAARAAAESAIKARSEFLANMNHELRTPLNAIMGFAQMVRDESRYGLSEEQRGEYAEYILQSADLLLGHINTILEVAALESGAVEPASEEIALDVLLGEAIERATVRANAAGVVIDRRDEGEKIAATGDPVRTAQSIDHLLQSAIKACGEGGRILVRAIHDETGRAEIAVRDDGAGMTDDEVNKALDAFSETHRGLDRAFSGPGVGYAIARTFAELQGGQFFIKSVKGKGTLVRIVLPGVESNLDDNQGEREADASETPMQVEKTHAA